MHSAAKAEESCPLSPASRKLCGRAASQFKLRTESRVPRRGVDHAKGCNNQVCLGMKDGVPVARTHGSKRAGLGSQGVDKSGWQLRKIPRVPG